MEEQSSFQRAAMKQWIDLTNWSSTTEHQTLVISFSLLNSTEYLLTISHAEVVFEMPSMTAYLVRKGTPLPPNRPLPLELRLPISKERLLARQGGNTTFILNCKITFINALDKEVTQHLHGLLRCTLHETTFRHTAELVSTNG